MRKIKYLLWLIIAAVFSMFIHQNMEFFIDQRNLGIDLYFFRYTSPDFPNWLYFLAVFFTGILFSYFVNLSERFKNRKTIRRLNDQIAAGERRISEMEARLVSSPEGGYQEASSFSTGE